MRFIVLIIFFMLTACSAPQTAESVTSITPLPAATVESRPQIFTPSPTPQSISRSSGWTVIAEQENGVWDIFLKSPDGNETLRAGLSAFDPGYPAWYSIENEETFIFKSLSDGNQYLVEVTCVTFDEGCAPYVEVYQKLDPAPQATSTYTPESPSAVGPENINIGWIVFSARTSEAKETRDLYLLSPDGTEIKELGLDVYDPRQPAWSFDGQKIAFVGDRNIYEVFAGCVDLTEGCLPYTKRLTTSKWEDRYLFPAWSPDGEHLAFIYEEPNRTFDRPRQLGILDSGTNEVRLFDGYGWMPQWDLHLEKVALLDAGKDANLVLNSLDGSTTSPLLLGKEIDLSWAWSPDRNKILFLTGSDFDPEIHLFNLVTEEDQFIAYGSNPAWDPSGTLVVFSTFEGIHLHDLESGMESLLLDGPVFELAWSP